MPFTIIAGGGIVGLAAGLELRIQGHDVLVCERSRVPRADGAGIGLWPSAMAILDRYGIADDIIAASAPLRQEILDRDGNVLVHDGYPVDASGYPAICAYRPELIRILGHALGLQNVRFDASVDGFEEHASNVDVLFADGTRETADLLVGADGIWSAVRQKLTPAARPEPHGQSMWRAVVPAERLALAEPGVVFTPGVRGGWLHTGRGLVYWFVGKFQPPGVARFDKKHVELLREVDDWHSPLSSLIQATPADRILGEDIYVLPPVESLGSTRVVLVGDAAHAMSPHVAFGACLGLEDSVILGEALAAGNAIPAAITHYITRRRPRIRWAFDFAQNIAERARNNDLDYGRGLTYFLQEAVRSSPGITNADVLMRQHDESL